MMNAHDYARINIDRFREELKAWLRIPSISTDPAFNNDVQRAAEWLAEDMRRIGLQTVQIMPTGGHPLVYGEWLGAGPNAPTMLVYGHYDVQPAQLEDGWQSDPFEPIEREGRIYARGVADDKGQVFAHMKAIESLLATGGAPVNVKYLIEGEEESSSVNLPRFVRDHQSLLKADICLISDTAIHSENQPSIAYGVRGLVAMELVVTGPKRDLHSGLGGMIHNPSQVIAEIIARLHDPDGRVTVPGFYDDVLPLSDAERAILKQSDLTPEEWDEQIGAPSDWGEPEYTRVERSVARPTLEINGIYGGYMGAGFKTVIGARAGVKISCRLVPNQNAARIYQLVHDYLLSLVPPTVTAEINNFGYAEPALTNINHPAIKAAIRAYGHNWDKPVILTRSGGTLPIVADLQNQLGLAVILMGFALPDAGAHGPDENFSVAMFEKAISTIIHFTHEWRNA